MGILKFLQNKLNKKVNQTEKIKINKNLSCFDINIRNVKIKKINIK